MLRGKSEEEVALVRESSLLVGKTLAEVAEMIKPGVTPKELDKRAFEFISDNGAVPGFLNYNGFPNSLCISRNEAVVHGIPDSKPLVDGDILSVDCGVLMNGFFGDSAYTFAVGNVSDEITKLLETTKRSLEKGIEQAIVGNRVGDIGYAVQFEAESNGFGVVRELVGHGLGRELHEPPEVPNFGRRGKGPRLIDGLVIDQQDRGEGQALSTHSSLDIYKQNTLMGHRESRIDVARELLQNVSHYEGMAKRERCE